MISNSYRIILFLALIGSLFSCQSEKKKFVLLSADDSGIDFRNELKPTEDLNILTYLYYYNGAGVTIADFNNDGLNDIYLTSNQGPDKFYVNRGNLKFEDVTEKSGIENSTGWSTGVNHVDINNDGLLDIYICKVGNYKSIRGSNLLFVNKGVGENNIPIFEESAQAYGLDIVAFSTQAAFFDYDLDGDLDMYLLSHSVYPNRSYGRGETRLSLDSLAGDRLLENVNGKYVDVSREAGIFQGRIGYGLGLSIGDLNKDGYPDIYVGNDFFENDYLYQNNGDKTFIELNTKDLRILGHTSHYSMGNCIADINNDGRVDIMSLDMLPEDLLTLKSSGVEDGYPIYNRFLENGYSPQFMQNTLHLNNGNGTFSEVAFQAGIAATEWSWGVLAADYDMDGLKDLYITNGILGATNDMDYINFISQDQIQRTIERNAPGGALDITRNIPEKKLKNFCFKNNGNASFANVTDLWFEANLSLSNGSAYGDLDNDGDLDLVVNNVNQNTFVLRNLSNDQKDYNYLSIQFQGPPLNIFGVGATVEIFANELYLYEENFPVKSYLSAVPNGMVMGLGSNKSIDSIRVRWPNSAQQVLYNIEANQTVSINHRDAIPFDSLSLKAVFNHYNFKYLINVDPIIDYTHHEEMTLDFERDPLIPFALSNEGPGITIGDINGDSLEDIFIGGGKLQASQLFIQHADGNFTSTQDNVFQIDARSEDIDQVFFDADNDLDLDLLVVSGGNEFTSGAPLKPRLYINDSGHFSHNTKEFNDVSINASVVRLIDIENDGDTDLVICSNALPRSFGLNAMNYIFKNDGNGHFIDVTTEISDDFQNAGLVTDVKVGDFDGNGYEDLVVVGTWMPIKLYMNDGKKFTMKQMPETEGWWRSIGLADFDNDGDLDFVAGNWGLNSRLSSTSLEPVRLYRNDFDDNGSDETLITYFYQGKETFLSSMDEITKQMPFIKKKYTTYNGFAMARIKDVFDDSKIKESFKKEVKVLSTCYFENDGQNNFKRHILPSTAQQSSVNVIAIDDFNDDGYLDLLMAGNNYEISTQLGRLDASHGVLMLNDQSGFFIEDRNQSFDIPGPARDIKKLIISGNTYYVVTINNNKPVFLKKKNKG